MAYATIDGKRHAVRVSQDLSENFALEVYPEPLPGAVKESEPFKNWPAPLCYKLRADTPEEALLHGLEQLMKLGKISGYHLEEAEKPQPKPPPPQPAQAPPAKPTAKPATGQ